MEPDEVRRLVELIWEGSVGAGIELTRYALRSEDDEIAYEALQAVAGAAGELREHLRVFEELEDLLYSMDSNAWHKGHVDEDDKDDDAEEEDPSHVRGVFERTLGRVEEMNEKGG